MQHAHVDAISAPSVPAPGIQEVVPVIAFALLGPGNDDQMHVAWHLRGTRWKGVVTVHLAPLACADEDTGLVATICAINHVLIDKDRLARHHDIPCCADSVPQGGRVLVYDKRLVHAFLGKSTTTEIANYAARLPRAINGDAARVSLGGRIDWLDLPTDEFDVCAMQVPEFWSCNSRIGRVHVSAHAFERLAERSAFLCPPAPAKLESHVQRALRRARALDGVDPERNAPGLNRKIRAARKKYGSSTIGLLDEQTIRAEGLAPFVRIFWVREDLGRGRKVVVTVTRWFI